MKDDNSKINDMTAEIMERGIQAMPVGLDPYAALFAAMAAINKGRITLVDDDGDPRTFGLLAMQEDAPGWECTKPMSRWMLAEWEDGEDVPRGYFAMVTTTMASKAVARVMADYTGESYE